MSEWRSIDSAPKDGRHVRLYGCVPGRHVYGYGYYFRGVPGDGEGWIAHAAYTEPKNDARGSFTPTHWKPLDDPPALSLGETTEKDIDTRVDSKANPVDSPTAAVDGATS